MDPDPDQDPSDTNFFGPMGPDYTHATDFFRVSGVVLGVGLNTQTQFNFFWVWMLIPTPTPIPNVKYGCHTQFNTRKPSLNHVKNERKFFFIKLSYLIMI